MRRIESFKKEVEEAKAGDNIGVELDLDKDEEIKTGHVLSDSKNNPAREVKNFIG